MQADEHTLSPTLPHRGSDLTLPAGVVVRRDGLSLPDGLSFEDWKQLGASICRSAYSVMFLIGDWLAYGEVNYESKWPGGRLPTEFWAEVELMTGIKAGTLRDAKTVCQRFTFPRRRENVNYWMLREISCFVGGESVSDLEMWQDRVIGEKMSRSQLRSSMRKHYAKPGYESVTPDRSFVAEIDVFVGKFMAQSASWSPAHWSRIAVRMRPVIEKLRPYSAKGVEEV
jgi:hypothetical protein